MQFIKTLDQACNLICKRKEKISVAESVTAGSIQLQFSRCNDASKFFSGGITAYSIPVKRNLLDVNGKHLESCNAVSKDVACQMAIHVNKLFKTDWSVAITGYASPTPELEEDMLYAYYAFAYRNKVIFNDQLFCPVKPFEKVQKYYTKAVLKYFVLTVQKKLFL